MQQVERKRLLGTTDGLFGAARPWRWGAGTGAAAGAAEAGLPMPVRATAAAKAVAVARRALSRQRTDRSLI